jgi:hypothetical protein
MCARHHRVAICMANESFEPGPKWLEEIEILAVMSLKAEVERVKKKRQDVQEKLRRMAEAYVGGLSPDEEYQRQKRLLEYRTGVAGGAPCQCCRRGRKAGQ